VSFPVTTIAPHSIAGYTPFARNRPRLANYRRVKKWL